MRLLNTRTFELTEYFGVNIPPYAILSHRWVESEVTFQDLQLGKAQQHSGWPKILGCCNQAWKDGYEYVWIDSCCIDKSSSAELSEAINSMFQWYEASDVCYAYLSEVTVDRDGAFEPQFTESKWFTRGWTLQELLAPRSVVFYNCEWREVGTKSNLESLISSITGIRQLRNFRQACVAQKMSWASERVTLRIEDMAYCLMGLFGVNMPLLYGEGEKAFHRLQIEIMRVSDDESLFAWVDEPAQFHNQLQNGKRYGLLAESPRAFKRSGDVERLPNTRKTPYTMTNKGLQIELELAPSPAWVQSHMSGQYPKFEISRSHSTLSKLTSRVRKKTNLSQSLERLTYMATLSCAKKNEIEPLAIALVKLSPHSEEYSRIICSQFMIRDTNQRKCWRRTVFIREDEGSIRHRGPTTIMLNLLHDKSFVGLNTSGSLSYKIAASPLRYKMAEAQFHPGLLRNRDFVPQRPGPDKSAIHLEDFGPSGLNLDKRDLFAVGFGITLLKFARENHKDYFVVEVGISQEEPPVIDILDLKDVRKKLREPAQVSWTREDGTKGIHREVVPGTYVYIRVLVGEPPESEHHGLFVKIYGTSANAEDIARLSDGYEWD